jgi:hypothetical protein
MLDRINTLKSYIRDINLSMLMSDSKFNVELNTRKRFNTKFRLLMPNKKLIKYVTELGGVITGSRSMKCYSINGKPVLKRKCIDWDFIITREMMFKIADKFEVEYNLVDDFISVCKQRWWVHPAYSGSYRVGPVDVQLIVKDELPNYIEQDGVRVCKLDYVVNEKVKMINDLHNTTSNSNYMSHRTEKVELEKHIDDLNEMIIMVNS